MTQQPFYPQPQAPQYPQAPQQPYAQPAYPQQPYAQPGFPQQAAPQQPYAQPGYPQAPAQPPAQPLAQGTLDDFYNQPSVGGGPSISWTDKAGNQKPIGTSYVGTVARDVTAADVQQETDYKTQQPKFYRDGRPKFVMKVPLHVQPSQEFPEGEAALYVKGQTRDELVRAMTEAGVTGSPKAGAVLTVTLVHRKPMGAGMSPANVVQIQYSPGGGQAPAPQQAPVQQQAQAPQPVQQQAPQYAQPQAAPQQAYAQPQAPAPQYQAPAPQVQQQAPAQPLALPSDLSPEQQALFAQIAGQQQSANPAA